MCVRSQSHSVLCVVVLALLPACRALFGLSCTRHCTVHTSPLGRLLPHPRSPSLPPSFSHSQKVFLKKKVLPILLRGATASSSSSCTATRQHAAGAIANLVSTGPPHACSPGFLPTDATLSMHQCNFDNSRAELLRLGALPVIANALWNGADKLRLHASRGLRLLGVSGTPRPRLLLLLAVGCLTMHQARTA